MRAFVFPLYAKWQCAYTAIAVFIIIGLRCILLFCRRCCRSAIRLSCAAFLCCLFFRWCLPPLCFLLPLLLLLLLLLLFPMMPDRCTGILPRRLRNIIWKLFRYSANRTLANFVSISSTALSSPLRNVNRSSIWAYDNAGGTCLPVLLIAVSISHSNFFDMVNSSVSSLDVSLPSLRSKSSRFCLYSKNWNAPTNTCASRCRLRKLIYIFREE